MSELDPLKVKKLKGELLTKYGFKGICDGCDEENAIEYVKIKGLRVPKTCNCGETTFWVVQHNEDGIYSLRDETLDVYNEVLAIFNEYGHPLTVRQVFYQLSSRDKVEKSEKGYRQTANHLKEMRFKGVIPFGYFADNSRYQIKPDSFGNMEDYLNLMQDYYRRDFWQAQSVYIEIWVEKDALRSVFAPITQRYDVPLMVAKGYSSLTFLYEAAENIKHQQRNGKDVHIYQFGDHDPSGLNAADKIHETLSVLCDGITYERIALTPEQIAKYNLPTRPTKKSDTRAKMFTDEQSCELDALPPDILRELIRKCIEQHIDQKQLERHKAIESAERETLKIFNSNFKTH